MIVNASRAGLPPGLRKVHNRGVDRASEDFVRVYSTASITDGYLAKGRLEAEGIPVLLKGEGEGPYRMGPVQLWVPEGLEIQARLILDAVQEGVEWQPAGDKPEGEEP